MAISCIASNDVMFTWPRLGDRNVSVLLAVFDILILLLGLVGGVVVEI